MPCSRFCGWYRDGHVRSVVGLEFAVETCVIAFEHKALAAGLPLRVDYSPVGTHSWSYWNDHLMASWPTIVPAIGA